MVPTDPVALCLRFREPEPELESPPVEAFHRAPPSVGDARLPRSAAEVGVLAGGRQAPRAPIVVFFQHAGYGIPAITTGQGDGLPDLASWSVRPTVFGYLASVSAAPRRGPLRSRAAWVVAACLPLVLPAEAAAASRPTIVAAAPAKSKPPTQAPVVPPPPGADGDAEPSDDPAPVDLAPVEPVAEAPVEPADVAPVEPVPPTTAALQSGGDALDPAVVDAAWEGVDGFDVELELKGGGRMSGRVGAVQRDTFTLIQAKTGAVLVLPKSGVVSLRVRVAGPVPAKSGTGSIVGGGILTAVGAPVFVSGVVFLGLCPSCGYIHLPLLIIGGAALGGGIPLLVRGTRARRKYQEAVQQRGLAPVVARTPHGWSGGLRFRF